MWESAHSLKIFCIIEYMCTQISLTRQEPRWLFRPNTLTIACFSLVAILWVLTMMCIYFLSSTRYFSVSFCCTILLWSTIPPEHFELHWVKTSSCRSLQHYLWTQNKQCPMERDALNKSIKGIHSPQKWCPEPEIHARRQKPPSYPHEKKDESPRIPFLVNWKKRLQISGVWIWSPIICPTSAHKIFPPVHTHTSHNNITKRYPQ